MQDYNLIKNAHVDVIGHKDAQNKPIAQVIVNDEFIHTFDSKSRVSQALAVMEEVDLAARLSGGSYFFAGDKLIDFRDGAYNGFIHNEAAIEKLVELLGIREEATVSERRIMRLNTVSNSGLLLNKLWSDDEFVIPGYMQGGDFSSRISFTWSPFNYAVRGVFEIIRQICSNGMVGVSDLINCKVPLVNRWEEHLDIAAIQLRNLVQSHTSQRLSEMGKERATVKELQLIKDHASERLDFMVNVYDEASRTKLTNISKIADPKRHLSEVYSDEVFNNTSLSARAQGHLTKFDAWNLVTEMFTHTLETSTSTGAALQRIANGIVFPARDANKGIITDHKPLKSVFSDPEIAFFGDILA